MIRLRSFCLILIGFCMIGTAQGFAQGPVSKLAGRDEAIGALKAPDAQTVYNQAVSWFQASGSGSPEASQKFEVLWKESDRALLDRVAKTFALGDPKAAKLLAEAGDPAAPAPITVPDLLKDEKQSAFYRANLALAYAKALSNRRIHEEALDALRLVKPENVVDPAGYFFLRAVAEHALLLKNEAFRSIVGVVEDVADAPDRYKIVSLLMLYDMQTWKDKDLGWIARKMDNIERRLELARGGAQTQKMQTEVVRRLDEIIKDLENQQKGNSNGGACPNGGQVPGGGANPSQPMPDSHIATNPGPGNITPKRLQDYAKQWGKLPEKERAKAMAELTRDMPPRYREVIENYFKKVAPSQPSQP
jgi:hypothetical protein